MTRDKDPVVLHDSTRDDGDNRRIIAYHPGTVEVPADDIDGYTYVASIHAYLDDTAALGDHEG